MVEKRPYPGDQGGPNGDVKRAKPSAQNIADKLAEAKAKAAAIKAKMTAGANGAATPTPAAAASPAPAAGGGAADRLAAMKARMAALKSGGAPPTASSTASPPPRTDDRRPSEAPGPKYATTLGNRRTESPLPSATTGKGKTAKSSAAKDEEPSAPENPYFDPKTIGTSRDRISRALLFNRRGKYLEQASKLRRQTKLEEIKALLASKNRLAKLDENSERGFLIPAPPDVEWWDEGLLEDKTYTCIDTPNKLKIDTDDSIITSYVQHPVLLKAPQDQLLIPLKPMYLTTKEQAKLRRMRRAEEHKEQQAKIRLGLVPPPPPKVKRGNMMRVMGEQAIADPTAVEMLVEQQIAERADTHTAANEERKLSKEERAAKLAENQKKDAQKGLYMCVFKIPSLAHGKHRYQIDLNAKEHSLTGLTIFNPVFNLVIVEGGHHSIQKYKRLLLNRVKWTENTMPTEAQLERQVADPQWLKGVDEAGQLRDLSGNGCVLVFEGEVRQRAFRKWGSKVCESEGEAKEVLGRVRLDSLWALAKNVE